jgi:hypothetical protein
VIGLGNFSIKDQLRFVSPLSDVRCHCQKFAKEINPSA